MAICHSKSRQNTSVLVRERRKTPVYPSCDSPPRLLGCAALGENYMANAPFRVCVLAGSSKGNAVLLASDEGSLLVDAGISCKRIIEGMGLVGEDPNTLRGIVISHEHGDHISGVGPTARKLQVPVYATKATLKAATKRLGKLPKTVTLPQRAEFNIGPIAIRTFQTFHDAADAHALVACYRGGLIGVLTDVGQLSNLIKMRLRPCSTLVLEANYDPEMLMKGKYPWKVKQRILHNQGHLSNQDACRLVRELVSHRLKTVIFSHLSESNNTPEKLWETINRELPAETREKLDIHIASPIKPTAVLPID